MIVHFTPLDTETFTGTFDGKRMDIVKQSDSSWKVFIDQQPSNVKADSARACMYRVEEIVGRILKMKLVEVTSK